MATKRGLASANGPFEENDFKGTEPWTLLVQRVDHWHDAVAALRQTLPALPRWRFDDVMVSYATDGAGVGPHFDRYDVFLLQGSGRREWRIGPTCDDDTPQLTENGLNLIPPFEAHETYLLEPGTCFMSRRVLPMGHRSRRLDDFFSGL
ncbi:MAG: hypothetical protein CM15mP84_08360 [Cellvibrionales bacterium]|nr:MAG: hypothetical protein CM15mP84_08360 [Cellvibrionales bacterium]